MGQLNVASVVVHAQSGTVLHALSRLFVKLTICQSSRANGVCVVVVK